MSCTTARGAAAAGAIRWSGPSSRLLSTWQPASSQSQAHGAYGVVVDEDFTVDDEATQALRESMRLERGNPDLFDMGGDIDEIVARCEEETGLPAPRPPEFAPWALAAQERARDEV